jgi:hypothetical protein
MQLRYRICHGSNDNAFVRLITLKNELFTKTNVQPEITSYLSHEEIMSR